MSIESHPGRATDPAEASTVRLVRTAASGDPAAFEALAEARLGSSFQLASAILGDSTSAAEAVQHALIAAWTQLPRLEQPEAFDGWFSRLLVDECRMQLRRGRLGPEPPGTDRAGEAQPLDPGVVDETVVLDALQGAYERLDADDRAMIALHHLEGRPVAEIAGLLHLPAGTVKLRLHDAHAALVQALERL